MAYTIQAFIGDLLDIEQNAPSGLAIVSLVQGKALIPLTDNIREQYQIPFLPMTDEGVKVKGIPPSIESFAEHFNGPVAYIEAEFFGGDGSQASAIWMRHSRIFGPLVEMSAINKALRLLGVTKSGLHDEFAALDLGRHRDTNRWTGPEGS
jgi:hypothetical protein